MNDYQRDRDGYWSAASGRSPYRPATALTIEEWSDRHQDALRPVEAEPPGAVQEPTPQPQQDDPELARRIYRPRISGDIACLCGCGETFRPKRRGQRYKSDTHARRAQRVKIPA
jgi:hypothetical protein